MPLYEALLRPLLFRLDSEQAHHIGLKAISMGLVKARRWSGPDLSVTRFGVRFPNPIGLAAGFDKNGVALDQWRHLGFGFVEVGTVTRHAQPGNPRPRMFRLPEHRALINRLGFNNDGAEALARRLEKASPGIPIGVNLGKSKITPLEEAVEDYAYSYTLLKELGDYFVVNVSSPNTPGLRTLQDRPALGRILWRLKEIDDQKPLFVKIAPDLQPEQIQEVVDVCLDMGLTGIVCSNTTLSRPLPSDPGIEGGLSGAPLKPLADQSFRWLAEAAGGRLELIGVGGLMSGADIKERISMGAGLVQVYSGFVYGGPDFIPNCLAELTGSGPQLRG